MQTIPLFDRYLLRPLRPEDAEEIFYAINTQREHLGRWLPFVASTHRLAQTQEVVRKMRYDTANPVFTLRESDAFTGLIGFKSADPQCGSIEIGYWLREEYQGKGIVTAAVRTLCERAFAELGMRMVVIRCGVGNERSNRIPQRLGFRFDRTEKHGEQLSGGEWIDRNVYRLGK